MPKKIDDKLKARAVRLVTEHEQEYSSLTAAAAAVAKQLGVGKESVRRGGRSRRRSTTAAATGRLVRSWPRSKR